MYIHTYESSTVCKLANVATASMYKYISICDIYCIHVHTHIRIIYGAQASQRRTGNTGWRRCIECLKVPFRKRATDYRALLR